MPGDYYRPHVSPSRDALQSSIKESSTLHCPQRSLPAKSGTNLKSAVMASEETKPRFIGHEGKDCGTSSIKSPGSRSSTYIPLSPPVPDTPQAQRCDTAKTESAIAGEVSASTRMPCSSSHSSIVAPWNDHQTVVRLGSDDDRVCKRTCITSSEGSPLPESIDRCDNYGCNSFHSHLDCPSGKQCWGCRSLNHFTSDCPMTCTNCCAAGHIPKHCEDFELDPRTGIARPRRPPFQPGSSANTILPPLPGDKFYQCDNYPCRELHSHWDCPLTTACWGCRSSDHFWSGCHERCGKCGAQRHTAKYCDEFEMWGNGMSRPIRRPKHIATNAMKRKRENEVQRGETQPFQGRGCPDYPTPTSQQSSTSLQPIPAKPRFPTRRHDEFTILTGRKSHPSSTKPYRAEESRQEQQVLPEYISRVLTPPAYVPTTMDTLPARVHDENGNKIYCTFWLRTGRCAYRATTKGCSLLHKVPPDEPTRREIGISISAPWLRNDHVVQELERKFHGKPARSIGERANGPSSIQLRPSSKTSRSYPEPPNQATFRSNKRLRGNDQEPEPEPLRARTANKSSSSLHEPPKPQQNGKESVHEFFQSLGPPPEGPRMQQKSRTSTPTNHKPAAMTAELRPPQVPASPDSPLQRENPLRPTVLKEGASSSQESLVRKPDTPKTQPATILDEAHVEESMSAAMKAFEEEEYRKQKSHEAAMARKMEEQKLEYEHELRMMELRKMKQT
ncbi:hypothetical protein N7G274_003644 [Stereocaulon virgatum]|uniref:CCHC-type domain-containing protein n=1 Tax=Stereocaulon virgatum TaxID=373712 RepID=A0ABR4AE38_9LECA